MAAQGGLFAQGGAPSREALQAAQARLMHDPTLQFTFSKAPPPPPPPQMPDWLLSLFKFLGGLFSGAGNVFEWIFRIGLGVVLAVVLFFIAREILRTRWPNLFKPKPKPRQAPVDWRPDAATARALLGEADRLAAAGQYAQAVRVLLHRSIEDIEGRRPRLVRPAYTSREIAGLEGLPDPARSTFSHIADVVERSLFGGRDVDAAGFAECRQAYEAFAFPGAWA